MNPKIEKAIREGEALLAEKKRVKAEEEAQRAQEAREYDQKCYLQALKWVDEILPFKIKELTAEGTRYYSTTDKWEAQALKRAGWTVKESWVERCMDEGYDWGSYWSYEITW